MRIWGCLALSSAVVLLPAPVAADHVETFVAFDPSAGEFPEGVAVGKTGDVYVSLSFRDEIRRLTPSGEQTVAAQLPPGTGPAGLTLDPAGVIYTAAPAFDLETWQSDPARRGVYRVGRRGSVERLPGTAAMRFPNDVTLDERGNVYATDSVGGAVWRIPRAGAAELWVDGALLDGDGSFGLPFPVGANGIAVRHDRVVVANTERGLLVEIPIAADGSAGPPTTLVQAPVLVGADGIAFDVHGRIYVVSATQNLLLRVDRDGSIETLATADDGLNQPSTAAFGTGRAEHRTLYVANFSIFPAEPTPGILSVPVGVPGQPVP